MTTTVQPTTDTDQPDFKDIVSKIDVETMCVVCATVRSVKRRTANGLRLRCATCGTVTRHDPLTPGKDDWREDINSRANYDLFLYRRDLDVARRLGVTVTESSHVGGGFADYRWYLDGTCAINLRYELPVAEKNRLLRWAFHWLLPSSTRKSVRFEDAHVADDEDGRGPYRGFQYVPNLADHAMADEFAKSLLREVSR